MIYNINAMVEVKLTEHGKTILLNYYPDLLSYNSRLENDIYRTELWSIMQIFGESMYMGNNSLPFVNNEIKFLDDGK